PPGDDLAGDAGGLVPAEERQGIARFGDEHVAAQELERRAGRIRLAFVIARHHPDATAALDPDLPAAEHVSGAVQRDRAASHDAPLAVTHRLDACVARAPPEQASS